MTYDKSTSAKILEIVNNRRIIEGPQDNYMGLHPSRYPWAADLFMQMQANEWKAENIVMGRDVYTYENEPENSGDKIGVDRALAFLTNLDAIQVDNIATNLILHVTDPTIRQCMRRQIWEEALHVHAYQYMVEAMCPNPMVIYDMANVDTVLKYKNDFIMAQAYTMKRDGFSPEKFAMSVWINILLEMVFFQTGFALFYIQQTLRRKYHNCADMIRYIQRDETAHGVLFINMLIQLRIERPEIFTPEFVRALREITDACTKLEGAWGAHIVEGGIPGTNGKLMQDYVYCLADEYLAAVGYETMYNVKNPYPWIKQTSKVNSDERNFFEGKPTNYSKEHLSFEDDEDE